MSAERASGGGGRKHRGEGPRKRRLGAVAGLAALVLALVPAGGCESERWDTVATQAVPHGAVRVWAAQGRLHAGHNALLVDVVGPAADESLELPRLTFEKPETPSGFRLRAEAILRAAGKARFRGRVEFPESGTWNGRLEIAGETVALTVAVE